MPTSIETTIGGQAAHIEDHGFRAGLLHVFEQMQVAGGRDQPRTVHVLVPRDYDPSSRRYRVVYMNDGNTAFFPGGPANLSWNMAATLAGLYDRRAIEPVIVVAVFPIARNRDYTHVPWGGPDCCGVEAYTRILADDIKPFIDANYATQPEPQSTLMLGSSHGGLCAFYVGNRRPDRFGVVAALSSSFWLGLDMRTASSLATPSPEKTLAASVLLETLRPTLSDRAVRPRILLEWGLVRNGGPHNSEIEERATVRGREMAALLVDEFGYRIDRDLITIEDPRGEHNEITWERHSQRVLEFFFAA
jgi:Predicted hydrolase of the alpha/beta superfamily